jgi:hypothetical protein
MTVAIRFVSLQMPDHPLITQAYAQRANMRQKSRNCGGQIAGPELFVLPGY